MLILKIVTTLIIVSLTPFVVIRDWHYHDRRTKRHVFTTKFILVCWVVGCFCSVILVWNETYSATRLSEKVDDLLTGKDSQAAILNNLSERISIALENECLKDLDERKAIIKQLHDKTFQISKDSYENFVDSIFDEIKQLKNKKEQLSTEQRKLSDESLIYFELLTSYVLDKFDHLISQLKQKNEVLNLDTTKISEKYIYADNGESIVIRDVQLKNNKRIRFKITNRKLDNEKLLSLPSIGIIGNEQSPRISITGPPIKELRIGPQPGIITGWSGQVLEIKYPLGEDPLMSESFRDNIDQKISEFIKLLYF